MGLLLGAGVMLLCAVALVAVAWIRGGVRPAQMVEVPLAIGTGAPAPREAGQ